MYRKTEAISCVVNETSNVGVHGNTKKDLLGMASMITLSSEAGEIVPSLVASGISRALATQIASLSKQSDALTVGSLPSVTDDDLERASIAASLCDSGAAQLYYPESDCRDESKQDL